MVRHHADEARTAGAYRAQAKVHGASKQDPPPVLRDGRLRALLKTGAE